MKKKPLFLLLLLHFFSIGFCQYASLLQSPMYIKGKKNFYQDSSDKKIIPIEHLDSLYRQQKNDPFHIRGYTYSGDSVIWQVDFFQETHALQEKWDGQLFPLKDFTDLRGNTVRSADMKGKRLIVNCWSITCAPCIAEIPELNRARDSLGDANYVFLAITFDKAPQVEGFFKSDKLRKYLNTSNPEFKFTIIPGQDSLLNNVLGVTSYPTTFIVGTDGRVSSILEGVNLDEARKVKTYEEVVSALKKAK